MTEAELKRNQMRVAFGCFIGVLLASAFTASFSVFLLPVSKEFGWGRSVMSSAFFFAQLTAAICYPLFGMFIDKYGSRRALGPALALHGLSIMALSLLNGSMLQLYGLYFLLGIGVALTGYIAYVKLISGWFGGKRGTMIGLALGSGIAIGGTLSPQLANAAIDAFGWRMAYVVLGVPFFVLALPNLLLLKDPPRKEGGAVLDVPGLSLGEAVRTRTFWILFVAILFVAIGWEGPKGHIVAMLTDRGETKAFATNILSTVALFSSLGRIFGGVLLDRFQTPRIAVFFFSMILAGVALIDFATGPWLYLAAVILGFGVGVELDILAYFVSRYFGMRNYSQIYGAVASTAILSYGLGPMILGIFYDAFGNYGYAITTMQGMIVISVGLVLLLKPYVYASKHAAEDQAPSEEASTKG